VALNKEIVVINDKQGTDYECNISSIDDMVELEILSSKPNETEPSVLITLYQALPKADKLEFIIQKAVELGVTRIVPMLSKYCVSRMDENSFEKKLTRYNKIAFEAAKQSGRGIIPQVTNILNFEQAINKCEDGCSILYYEHGGNRTNDIIDTNVNKVNIYIGSEGGFSEKEVSYAVEKGVHIGTLGKLILRCETAPIAALTLVLNSTNNM